MADDLDAVIDAVAAIEDASGQATHIVGSPQSWADLSKFKQADNSNVSLAGAGTTARSRTLVSVPVLVSNSVPDGTMNLVGALRKAMATTGYTEIKEFQRVEIVVG